MAVSTTGACLAGHHLEGPRRPGEAACGVFHMVALPRSVHREEVALRVLVVDDSRHFRRTVIELLTLRGFLVVGEACNGPEALEKVTRECPDGVLLDVNMPEHDGYAVATQLTAVCPTTKVVLTSSETQHVPAATLVDCGAVAFVSKTELATCDLDNLFSRPGEGTPR